ncbi:MAG: hypothetical protein V6Z81_09845 [Parvularculales bacterium]
MINNLHSACSLPALIVALTSLAACGGGGGGGANTGAPTPMQVTVTSPVQLLAIQAPYGDCRGEFSGDPDWDLPIKGLKAFADSLGSGVSAYGTHLHIVDGN